MPKKLTKSVRNAIYKALRNKKVINNTTAAQRAAIRKEVRSRT